MVKYVKPNDYLYIGFHFSSLVTLVIPELKELSIIISSIISTIFCVIQIYRPKWGSQFNLPPFLLFNF